ncbi:mechanosensitive ion channel domain-containing protein [Paucibacter sp. AS339]|uniref:mechanosensitive ion channel domain-containing protein n=1 Tax=Paucibacter hankyongi TaxID=3133434 RepID=UPI003094B23C
MPRRQVRNSVLLLLLPLCSLLAAALELPKGVVPEVVRAQLSTAPLNNRPEAAASANTGSVDEWTRRLDKARAQHQKLQLIAPDSEPLVAERKLASARRLMLLSTQLQAQGDQANPQANSQAPVQARTLSGQPPFNMIEVDELRDQLDALLVRQAALKMLSKSLDAEVESAVDARIDAEANLRRRQDQMGLLHQADALKKAHPQLELSQIQTEVAELEVLQADQARARIREELSRLSAPIESFQREVARVSAHQQLSEADLARLLKEFARDKERVSAERIRLEARLGRQELSSPTAVNSKARLEPQGFELETVRLTITGLRELEALARERANLWQSRQTALSADGDAEKKQLAMDALNHSADQVQSRLQITAKYGDFLRAELRAQEARVQDLLPEDPNRAEQQRLLSALQTQLNVQERLFGALSRSQVLLARSLGDLGLRHRPDNARDWLSQFGGLAREWASSAWNYELFSATENTQIDGRIVTVDYGVTVGKSIGILIMLAAGYWLARWLSHAMINQMARRLHLSAALARVLRRWLNTILLLVVLMIVLKLARIPITAFAFLGGALAIGVGFGAQNVIKNLISGIIILFERKIRVGDIVSVGGISGTVQTVDLRATTVRGFDGIDAIVPNSNLLENQVSNWSGSSPDVRRVIQVGVAYGSDVRRATQLITECAAAHSSVLPEPPPEVFFDDFAADALNLRLLYWFRLNGPRSGAGVDSDLRFAINDALAAAGIAIAFPQRDVHLDMAAPLKVELQRVSPASLASTAPQA